MMSNIVERLKSSHSMLGDPLHREAWEEIERLREEVADLKDLIQSTVNYAGLSVSNQRYTFHKQTHKWHLPEETKND